MGESGFIKCNGPLLDSHMAQSGTGHAGFGLLGCITFVDHRQSSLRSIVGDIQKLKGVFDIMNALSQENKAVIVPGFVHEVLGLSERRASSARLFKLIQ